MEMPPRPKGFDAGSNPVSGSIRFYVAVDHKYKFDWTIVEDDLPDHAGAWEETILSKQYNVKVKFICNDVPGIVISSNIFEVEVENEQEAFLFLLRTGFPQVDKNKVDTWRYEINGYSDF